MTSTHAPVRRALVAALAVTVAATSGAAQGALDPGHSGLGATDGIAVTHHRVTVRGRALRYTARAGRIPIRVNSTGEVHAWMYFVAYSLDGAPKGTHRPVSFLWNGGPGSSSSLVHLLGFGPQRLTREGAVVPNDGTWLGATDLVFVDPIGTGYSRPVKAEYGAEFYSDRGDAESVAEFIRVYLNRAEAWDAPLFLVGESFGVRRAGRVADVLEKHGTKVRGVVLIGLGLPLDTLSSALMSALAVPTYAAAARFYHLLPGELDAELARALSESRAWALATYLPALRRRDSLTEPERRTVKAGLSRFTAIPADRIDDKTLTIPLEQFAAQLRRPAGKVIGRYDTRLSGPIDTTENEFDPTKDPSLVSIIDDHAVLRYMRDELDFATDLKYQGPFGGGYPPATHFRGDWMSVMWEWNPPVDSTQPPPDPRPPLLRVLLADPEFRVLVACGYYDLMCDFAANEYIVSQLAPSLRGRVIARAYLGGHAVYTDPSARVQLQRDGIAFIEGR